jgi:hypothetical protein
MRHEPHQACRLTCHALRANIHEPPGAALLSRRVGFFCFRQKNKSE